VHSPPRAARILVVDDDPLMLELLTTRLDLAGHEAHGARDGRQALARLRDLRPAAMVLDINMPEMSGFDVLVRLREIGQLPGLPVMVLTARHETSDVQRAVTLGARDYLAKPFHDQQFLLRINRLLRAARPAAPQASRDDDELLI
jgi:DNA-binding response OmpR family regulator